MLRFEFLDERIHADAGRHCERADVIRHERSHGRDEIGQRSIRFTVRDRLLLAQHVEPRQLVLPGVVLVHHDVVAVRVGRPETVDRARLKPALFDDALEQLLRVLEELARRRAVCRVIENRGESAFEFPRGEEERPVDERHQLFDPLIADDAFADKPRRGHVERIPVGSQMVRARLGNRQQLLLAARAVLRAQLLLVGLRSCHEIGAEPVGQETGHHVDRP